MPCSACCPTAPPFASPPCLPTAVISFVTVLAFLIVWTRMAHRALKDHKQLPHCRYRWAAECCGGVLNGCSSAPCLAVLVGRAQQRAALSSRLPTCRLPVPPA